MMERIENLINVIDYIISSKRRRHLAGGLLLGLSSFFGVIAITAMTLSIEDEGKENEEDE